MKALDATFLVDYLDGVEATANYLEERENTPFFAPTLALFEVYTGVVQSGGADQLEPVLAGIDWVEPLPLTRDAAAEAARIRGELLAAGERVNLGDTLIAGICRDAGATIVTRDSHFSRVPNLSVEGY